MDTNFVLSFSIVLFCFNFTVLKDRIKERKKERKSKKKADDTQKIQYNCYVLIYCPLNSG